MHLRKTQSLGIAIGLLAAITTIPASAQVLQIMITDNLGHSLTVADGSANDSNPNANAVSVDSALFAAFPNLVQPPTGTSNVTASFSQPGGSQSRLTTTGDLFGNTGATFTVISSINGVVIPTGPVRMFNDTNTVSFNSSPGTNGQDTNGVSTANTLFGQDMADTTFSYTSTGVAPNSGAGMGPGFSFLNTGAFAVTSKTVIQVIANGESQYTTNSIIQAPIVPEPGAFAMFACLGVTGSLFALRKVRRSKK